MNILNVSLKSGDYFNLLIPYSVNCIMCYILNYVALPHKSFVCLFTLVLVIR